jgi:hypothetical protein
VFSDTSCRLPPENARYLPVVNEQTNIYCMKEYHDNVENSNRTRSILSSACQSHYIDNHCIKRPGRTYVCDGHAERHKDKNNQMKDHGKRKDRHQEYGPEMLLHKTVNDNEIQ